jgi:spermidine synthase
MVGTLYTIDFHGVADVSILDNVEQLTARLKAAVAQSGLTAVGEPLAHKFVPQGVTLVMMLSQSHLAAHTWPEKGLMTVDFFTCGDAEAGMEACAKLQSSIPCARVVSQAVDREAQYREELGHGEKRVFRLEDVLLRERTPYTYVEIVKTEGYGLALFLDGQRQSSEADEFIYHEMLVHPAMMRHSNPRKILIAGGGEGAVAREVLRHSTVESVLQVDLDERVIAACRRHLPSWNAGSFDNPRFRLTIGDARAHLKTTADDYDIIFLDLPEWSPGSAVCDLFTTSFYDEVSARLRPNGLAALQVGPAHPVHVDVFVRVARAFMHTFPHTLFYAVPELRWGFAVGSRTEIPNLPFDASRVSAALRYYNAELHGTIGALPAYIRAQL